MDSSSVTASAQALEPRTSACTASGSSKTFELIASAAPHIDLVVFTYPARAAAIGPARATALDQAYADALGHVPEMPKEIVG